MTSREYHRAWRAKNAAHLKAYRKEHEARDKASTLAWRAANPEKVRAAHLKASRKYDAAHKVEKAAREKARRAADLKKYRAAGLAYYYTHRDERRAYRKGYRMKHAEEKATAGRAWRKANRPKERKYALRKYNLTPEQFDAMEAVHGGVCKICKQPPKRGKRLCVDHCHETGIVRGLLCYRCNVLVGFVESTDHGVFMAALQYVEDHVRALAAKEAAE